MAEVSPSDRGVREYGCVAYCVGSRFEEGSVSCAEYAAGDAAVAWLDVESWAAWEVGAAESTLALGVCWAGCCRNCYISTELCVVYGESRS